MSAPPASVLEKIVPQTVRIRLKDGREMSGRLLGVDEHLNMVLDDTEEAGPEVKRRLGRIVLRGSSVVEVEAQGPSGTGRPS